MPRTKQNHPKNLKDKIEEAQKELKEPNITQKGLGESGRRHAEVKGLKRKKVIGENQQKKVPKSPVKKPPQSKPSEAGTFRESREPTASCSFSRRSSQNITDSSNKNGDTDSILQVRPQTAGRLKGEATPSPAACERLMQTEVTHNQPASCALSKGGKDAEGTQLKEDWMSQADSGLPSHSSAPLEVLLKAMEPDLSSLTRQKSSFPGAPIGKVDPVPAAQPTGQGSAAIPAVSYGIPSQPIPAHYYPRPQVVLASGDTAGQVAPLQFQPLEVPTQSNQTNSQHNAMKFSPAAANHPREKHDLQQLYGAVPAASLTHTPVPPSQKALPQSQPVVYTCQSVSASVPSTIQVPVTPGYNQVQMATIVNPGLEQVSSISGKDQKPKKQGKYVCEYCNRACAKPSVLLKHKRSHTGERPYPCVTCDFSFKTKSNLYKHKKSHAHAIKLGKVVRSDSGSRALSQESDKGLGTHSDVEESAESDKESVADLDPDCSQSSSRALSESSLQSACATQDRQGEVELPAVLETLKSVNNQKPSEPKATLPKVVVHPVNVSPLRADSPRAGDSTPELATAQRQREFQTMSVRPTIKVLSSLKEVDCTSPPQEAISEVEDQVCKSPPGGGHAQLQRQQATDFSQQQQGKCLLSPRSLGSTDSGYFSRSESADQAMSPPSPFVKIIPPTDMDVSKNMLPSSATVVATVMQASCVEKPPALQRQIRPPLETKALSLEEHISKLISDNEAVVDDKQLDSVKPRRTSLSRRGSIDSPKSYIFKDSFQFDLKPMGRRSSSSSDIPKSPFTPTDKSKQVFLLSVPSQYPSMDCLPITRSNSMPTTPGYSAIPIKAAPQPHPLRVCQSFDDKISSSNDDVFISAPPTPNPAMHPRTLVRQIAIEDSSATEGHSLSSARSMDEGYRGPNIYNEVLQRSKSFEQGPAPERSKKPQQNKGTMYECETCRNRYRKLENFENHKKFYCSELHGPKNKSVPVRETDPDQCLRNVQQSQVFQGTVGVPGLMEQVSAVRKRRKMKSVGDDDDQSPTDTNPPCSGSFDSCQMSKDVRTGIFSQHSVLLDLQSASNLSQVPHMQLIARSTETSESRLSPIRETQINICSKEREVQRQGSGTSVIRHTNSLSRPNSFETSESIDKSSPVDILDRETQSMTKTVTGNSSSTVRESQPESAPLQKCASTERPIVDQHVDHVASVPPESSVPVQQSRLVRQNNIQVPEILVTEEPDREQESLGHEPEKHLETFNWPQRSESLSKLPTEKLPPKKKRIRLAQMEHSSGESSFESTLSRSLSRDSSLSRGSSISASFDRDDLPRSESPVRVECAIKLPEFQGLSLVNNTLGVPDSKVMRRAASEQISCTQPSGEIDTDYRSKSFDCGTISPTRSLSPLEKVLPKSPQAPSGVQVPLLERRRGPLVRQMSLKIGPESQQQAGKQILHRNPSANAVPVPPHRPATRPVIAQPLIPHQVSPVESLQQPTGPTVQSINLGSQTQHPTVHGLPHPWHQSTRVMCQSVQQLSVHDASGSKDFQNNSLNSQDKHFVPKYQLQYSAVKTSQTYSLPSTQVMQISPPVSSLPVANEIASVSKPTDGIQNVCVIPQNHQVAAPIVLPICLQGNLSSFNRTGVTPLPQILVTHEQLNTSTKAACHNQPPQSMDSDVENSTHIQIDRPPVSASQINSGSVPENQNIVSDIQQGTTPGGLQYSQKVALCPQQEPTASSKRMLSPANSLDIAMEKHQKRVKDDHSAACLTDGRSFSYLNSKMAEVTRQRKLILVRQVCTTESVDSPVSSESPQLDQEKPEETTRSVHETETNRDATYQVSTPAFQSPGHQASSSLPANSTLKSLGKSEERKSPGKSPLRPATFHGQVKLVSSVSVVNTRDSHRLSFPSLKTTTSFTWCYLMKRKPLHIPQTDHRISAYSTWAISKTNPNPLGLPTKVVMSLFDSKQTAKKMHYTQAITTSLKSDILTYSSKLKDSLPKVLTPQTPKPKESTSKVKSDAQQSNESDRESSSSKTEPRRVKIFDGGYKSNEEYVYVRGRGRGKYICEECGIRCKKPSMLRKHIRTHSDVRPYHCVDCNFSFKTKGNLTKHMKSKTHSKKCMEMGVSVSPVEDADTEDSGDRTRMVAIDRPGSDGDESDGPDDEDNDAEEEDEEDSQAESSLSATPSVSASPQHVPSVPASIPPSALLAQMSLSNSPPPAAAPTTDCQTSDTESVTMMSPISPCRQMSIDYPDSEVPVSPPSDPPPKPSQDILNTPSQTGEAGVPVDRGTQTSILPCSTYSHQGPLHFLPQSQIPEGGASGTAHLFSHLPLHSQQPARTPYSMVPVGGIQLVPAGLAAYSTFVPVRAGHVQLTIPAVSVIHRGSGPHSGSGPDGLSQAEAAPEPSGVLPCLPIGQVGVAGLQTLGPPQALQPLGLDALGLMGLANTGGSPAQLLPQPSLAINAVGLQVLAASPIPQGSPAPQGSPTPQTHLPSLQILNFTLPAIIPSLSPLPPPPEPSGTTESASTFPSHREAEFPVAGGASAVTCPAAQLQQEVTSAGRPSTSAGDAAQKAGATSPPNSCQPMNGCEKAAQGISTGGIKEHTLRQHVTVDYNDASSDDEDRLVIAT
ncbi:zinc finger protein 40 isoform X1 [Paramormyrops kingsleyae]|uniref:zinc finger protein 40 isoform X1 n=3 Tax=Paramormyrops kingsleyae TaxID=1676925 RepID=UPI003B974BFD